MKKNDCITVFASVSAHCSEYQADFITDIKNCSVIFNVESEYFRDLEMILKKHKFRCVHKNQINSSVTACFLYTL